MKTDDELKQIALDLYHGLIFSTGHIENPEDAPRVFMPFSLMDGDSINEFKKQDPGLVYEYLEKAAPRSINGLPIFFSFQFLTIDETKKMEQIYKKIVQAVDTALES